MEQAHPKIIKPYPNLIIINSVNTAVQVQIICIASISIQYSQQIYSKRGGGVSTPQTTEILSNRNLKQANAHHTQSFFSQKSWNQTSPGITQVTQQQKKQRWEVGRENKEGELGIITCLVSTGRVKSTRLDWVWLIYVLIVSYINIQTTKAK